MLDAMSLLDGASGWMEAALRTWSRFPDLWFPAKGEASPPLSVSAHAVPSAHCLE